MIVYAEVNMLRKLLITRLIIMGVMLLCRIVSFNSSTDRGR